VEQFTSTTNAFGQRFTGFIVVIGIIAVMIPNASASLMFGQAISKFTGFALPGSMFANDQFGVMFWAYFCTVVGTWLAFMGPNILKWFTRIAAAGMIVVLIALIIYIVFYYGLDNIFKQAPRGQITPTDDPILNKYWNRASACELNFGMGIAWAFNFGQWTRMAKTEAGGYHGCMWGWGLLSVIAGAFSAFTAIATGIYDPTTWVLQIGGETASAFLAAVGLLLIGVANISSIATVNYTMSLSARVRFPSLNGLLP
jgi:hypothetical protein